MHCKGFNVSGFIVASLVALKGFGNSWWKIGFEKMMRYLMLKGKTFLLHVSSGFQGAFSIP